MTRPHGAEKHGRELFGRAARSATRSRPPTRSRRSGRTSTSSRPPKALVLDAIQNGRSRGNGQMAAELVTGEDAEDVAKFVASWR